MNSFTSKERFNAKANSVSLKDVIGEKIDVTAVDFAIDGDKEITYFKSSDDIIYSSISKTVASLANEMQDFDDDEIVTIKIISKKSKQGRDYITLELC
jgi:hypothetical protein